MVLHSGIRKAYRVGVILNFIIMKKQKIQKLGINKATISQLTQDQLNGGGTFTCHGHSCCPTEAATCANTCANTCPVNCGVTAGCTGTSGSGPTRFCPTIQI